MHRRGFLVSLAVVAAAGCLGDDEPRFMGPTEEDPDVVDVRYRAFTESEVTTIREDASEIPYDDLQSNIDAHVGAAIVFRGTVIVITEHEDHFVYQISMAGDPTRVQWAFGSWAGPAVEEASRIIGWGEVLGPEVFTQGMGEELTVPAIALADVEILEG